MNATGPAGDVNLGGPRQRAVLAILLIARGDVVSADTLADDLWNGEPPARATGALQAYISNLRRALEPDRAPRTPSTILISKAPGYAVHLKAQSVDAWHFESLLRRAATENDPAARRATLTDALDLWRGDAYAEVSDQPWAEAEITRLTELRTVARERVVAAALDCGLAAEAVVDATALTRTHPLREEGWRLLALALYSSGRQADALSALRRARTILGDELGVDPGPALVDLEAAVLAHRVTVNAAPAATFTATDTPCPPSGFVGRADELRRIVDPASTTVLLSGEAGAGKTALLQKSMSTLERSGWTCLLGRCPEAEGAPPAWAWTEILRAAAAVFHPGQYRHDLAPALGPTEDASRTHHRHGQFRLRRAVVNYLSGLAGVRRTVVILDDIHRADPETLALALLVAGARETTGRIRFVVAFRPDEGGSALAEALADLAARSPERIRLTGLALEESTALVREVSGTTRDQNTMRVLLERTEGNPFYLRESARLLESEGEVVATSDVPEGVADVLRRRFARLPELTVAMLRLAAVFGREANLDVLLAVADIDADSALDALDAGVVSGLLDDTDASTIRFTHLLVRDTLYSDLTLMRRRRWHAKIAGVLEQRSPTDNPALAFHYAQLSGPEHTRKALASAVAAAAEADARYAHRSAARFYADALDAWARLPDGSVDEQVELLSRRISAEVAGGASISAAQTRRDAVSIAERTGRADLLIRTLTAGELPTTWLKRDYGFYDADLTALIERALTGQDVDSPSRCRLLCALVDEVRGEEDDRAMEAAEEAYTLAHTLDDPEVLGLAVNALWNLVPADLEPERRMQLSQELIELGTAHEMPVFSMVGRHGAFLVDAAQQRFSSMRTHLDIETELAEKYSWQQSLATCRLSRGMLAHAARDIDGAHRHFDVGGAALRSSLAVNADAIESLAYVTTAVTTRTLGNVEPGLLQLYATYPDIACELLALALVERGATDEARSVRRPAGRIRRDFFESLFLTLRGMALLETGQIGEASAVYSALAPFSGQLAGMATGTYVIGPVDTVLARLATALGDDTTARRHRENALELAHVWGNPYWIDAATRKPQEHSK